MKSSICLLNHIDQGPQRHAALLRNTCKHDSTEMQVEPQHAHASVGDGQIFRSHRSCYRPQRIYAGATIRPLHSPNPSTTIPFLSSHHPSKMISSPSSK